MQDLATLWVCMKAIFFERPTSLSGAKRGNTIHNPSYNSLIFILLLGRTKRLYVKGMSQNEGTHVHLWLKLTRFRHSSISDGFSLVFKQETLVTGVQPSTAGLD